MGVVSAEGKMITAEGWSENFCVMDYKTLEWQTHKFLGTQFQCLFSCMGCCCAITKNVKLGSYSLQWYRVSKSIWEEITELPPEHWLQMPTAIGHKGRVIVIGGHSEQTETSSAIHMYNINTKTWSKLRDLPTSRTVSSSTIIGNTVYVGGGLINGECDLIRCNTVEAFTLSDSDYQYTQLCPTTNYMCRIVDFSGRLLAVGGCACVQAGPPNGHVEMLDPCSEEWVEMPSMMNGRVVHGTHVTSQGELVVIGGHGHWRSVHAMTLPDMPKYEH